MIHQEPELKVALNKFEKMLNEYPDDFNKSVLPFKNFLKGFLRIKTTTIELPTIEVMAILKHEKPNTFYSIKKNFQHDLLFDLLTHLEMEYMEARKKLSEIKELIE